MCTAAYVEIQYKWKMWPLSWLMVWSSWCDTCVADKMVVYEWHHSFCYSIWKVTSKNEMTMCVWLLHIWQLWFYPSLEAFICWATGYWFTWQLTYKNSPFSISKHQGTGENTGLEFECLSQDTTTASLVIRWWGFQPIGRHVYCTLKLTVTPSKVLLLFEGFYCHNLLQSLYSNEEHLYLSNVVALSWHSKSLLQWELILLTNIIPQIAMATVHWSTNGDISPLVAAASTYSTEVLGVC